MSDLNMITLSQITIIRNQNPVATDISCTIPSGILGAIVGPNGAGKSSLLQSLVKLIPMQEGSVTFSGKSFDQMRSSIAYVSQRANIDWHFPTTVYEVVLMGRFVHKKFWQSMTEYDHEQVKKSLERVDLLNFKDSPLDRLSGGQQQRVFIARALAQEPMIYLMDEPFAGVDKKTEEIIINLLKQESALGKTVLIVHHDLSTLKAYFQWALFLNKKLIAVDFLDRLNLDVIIHETFKGFLYV
jgi:manganese/zinc/iron transport system ATP- binding protein